MLLAKLENSFAKPEKSNVRLKIRNKSLAKLEKLKTTVKPSGKPLCEIGILLIKASHNRKIPVNLTFFTNLWKKNGQNVHMDIR